MSSDQPLPSLNMISIRVGEFRAPPSLNMIYIRVGEIKAPTPVIDVFFFVF
jgi:hypothetical protein